MNYRIEEQVLEERFGSMFYIQQSETGNNWEYLSVGPFSYLENAKKAMNRLIDKSDPRQIKSVIHHYP